MSEWIPQLRRRLQRGAEVDALRGGEELDRDDARAVRRHVRKASRAKVAIAT